MKLKNKYFIMRHGQAISNVKAMCSCWPEKFHNPLTKLGRKAVKESIEKFEKSGKTIDLIFVSPLLRAQQTAGIVSKILKIKVKIKTDKRLREIEFGEFNGKHLEAMWKSFKSEKERINTRKDGEETYKEISKRMADSLKDIDKKYGNPPSHKASARQRNIMIISHEGPLGLLQAKVLGLSFIEATKIPLEKRIHKAEIRELN